MILRIFLISFNQTNFSKNLSKRLSHAYAMYLNLKFCLKTYFLLCRNSLQHRIHYALTFANVARLPPDHIFGSPSAVLNGDLSLSRGLVFIIFKFCLILFCEFSSIRENLQSFCKREKNHHDIGADKRVFFPRKIVRLRLKSRAKGPSFQSELLGPHGDLNVISILVTLREVSSIRDCFLHHNRLSNQFLSGKTYKPRALNLNSNFQENEQDPKRAPYS